MCFTGNCDLLSQWRGYGDDGRGVAVGFRRSDINAFLDWWGKFELASDGKGCHLNHGVVYYRDKDDSFTAVTTEQMRHWNFMEERWVLTRGSMLRKDEITALKQDEEYAHADHPAPVASIGKIVIGPRCRASAHDIATLFSGYDEVPEIVRSDIPYAG